MLTITRHLGCRRFLHWWGIYGTDECLIVCCPTALTTARLIICSVSDGHEICWIVLLRQLCKYQTHFTSVFLVKVTPGHASEKLPLRTSKISIQWDKTISAKITPARVRSLLGANNKVFRFAGVPRRDGTLQETSGR